MAHGLARMDRRCCTAVQVDSPSRNCISRLLLARANGKGGSNRSHALRVTQVTKRFGERLLGWGSDWKAGAPGLLLPFPMEADAGPGPISGGSFLLRQARQQAQQQRRTLELRGRLEHVLDFYRFPAMGYEELRSLRWREFEGGTHFAQMPACGVLHHFQEPW